MRRLTRRWGVLLVIALAVLLTVQPVLHRHSLLQDTPNSSCPACAVGSACVVAAPQLTAPLVVAYRLIASAESTTSAAELQASSSRAPPRA